MTLAEDYAATALRHWKRWRPRMVRDMRREGTLDRHVQDAARRAADQVASLMAKGFQRFEAEEMVLPDLIIVTPESGVE